uniref:DDE Tnp4 domain-containing protein n=1 Tax=Meloidogyne enterolobii TaxID=390850 RepID=A0A6V7WHW4_MELEN|nr:unnamed protein product [Meloidogyne enterolobii]
MLWLLLTVFIFIFVDCSWPGSSHDSFILRDWLMTPYLNPKDDAEKRFNNVHSRARVKVEMTFGQWKRRFLINSFGYRTKLNMVPTHILTTCVLHNLAKILKLPEITIEEVAEETEHAHIPNPQPADRFLELEEPESVYEQENIVPTGSMSMNESRRKQTGVKKRMEITKNRFCNFDLSTNI